MEPITLNASAWKGILMQRYDFGNELSSTILVQPVDDHDLELIENEIKLISEMTRTDFRLIALKVDDWNRDLSPWPAPAVFGKEGFGDGAADTLNEILSICTDQNATYYIGGYSLAGLFALWAAFETDAFAGAAAASPSVWFPGFLDYMQSKQIKSKAVYLSLGDREERTKNPVMATVGDCIRKSQEILNDQGIPCALEWNQGNHFKDADLRMAKGFAWLLNEQTCK